MPLYDLTIEGTSQKFIAIKECRRAFVRAQGIKEQRHNVENKAANGTRTKTH